MAIRSPEEFHAAFIEAFNAGDRAALLEMYEPGASLVAGPIQEAVGHGPIGAVLDSFLGLKGKMEMTTLFGVANQDIALLRGRWRLQGTAPDGRPIVQEGRSTEVLRKQADGTWKLIIDDPAGLS